jgi:hypothetical protein
MAADVVAGEKGSAEFGIVGPLEVSRSGRAVPLGGPRQRAVLALLLLLEANRAASMDRLAEDTWGGHPPERAGPPPCRPTCSICAGRWSRAGPAAPAEASW